MEIFQNFVAFSEYMNFNKKIYDTLQPLKKHKENFLEKKS